MKLFKDWKSLEQILLEENPWYNRKIKSDLKETRKRINRENKVAFFFLENFKRLLRAYFRLKSISKDVKL